uniref:Uncharacterized protein n=1 Tax=Vespula pensylvanica TaxID=30213 RepID=A0A834NS57_VESPE|nr:hypothetical protein H0235_011424 [Vespula pensylvanica]
MTLLRNTIEPLGNNNKRSWENDLEPSEKGEMFSGHEFERTENGSFIQTKHRNIAIKLWTLYHKIFEHSTYRYILLKLSSLFFTAPTLFSEYFKEHIVGIPTMKLKSLVFVGDQKLSNSLEVVFGGQVLKNMTRL